MFSSLKNPLIISSVFSFLVLPILTIGVVFYYIFSNTSKENIFFNSVSVSVSESGFTFSLNPDFFIIMGIMFVSIFLVVFFIQKLNYSIKG
ncbi:hypothetical protein ACQKND_16355 [Viridibacillus arvi]|uniref:hypothetical protein n=1 Tax=Viridibacillus arvi TaxID=263475 RepID=UPI003D028AA6